LFLMPAGKFDDGLYSTRVNQFNWVDFFSNFPSLITQFAQYLRKKFKYVLIDSRTGYTDISGICTSIMPEKLVTVFTPNRQSLSGVVEMVRRATDYRKQSDDLRPLLIFPLPSRIENAESILKKDWRFGNSQGVVGYQKQLESVLTDVYSLQKCDLTNYFDEYQLQYTPRYSYGEELAVLSERSGDRLSIARSFENFAERIIRLENPWEEIKDSHSVYTEERNNYEELPQQTTIERKPATSINVFQSNWFRALITVSLFIAVGALIISAITIQKLALIPQSLTQVALGLTETSVSSVIVPTSTPKLSNSTFPFVTSTIAPTPIPQSAILLQEDFEDGKADGWGNSIVGDWVVEGKPNENHYLSGTGSGIRPYPQNWYGDASTGWTDYAFESRVMFVTGGTLFICIRAATGSAFYTAYINDTSINYAQYNPSKDVQFVSLDISTLRTFSHARWYKVRVEIKGNLLTTYVDDELARARLLPTPLINTQGGIGYYMDGGEKFYIDDIKVWSLK
jgi:hypothetical protein